MTYNEYTLDQMTILIVDDDPAQRMMLQETLIPLGVDVIEATNGLEAVELFKKSPPELILMDIKMPIMDGLEACAQIRALPLGKDIPIVLITGLDDHESIRKAFNVDATDFITKPVNWPILSHRVSYLLKASRATVKLRDSEISLSNAQRIAELGDWRWDTLNNKVSLSDQVYKIFGLSLHNFEATYNSFIKKVHPEDKDHVIESIQNALKKQHRFYLDFRIILPDGSERIVHSQGEVTFSFNGEPIRMLGTIQNITQRTLAERKIQHLAYYDGLTGLPNREHFKQSAEKALEYAIEHQRKFAIIFLDLDEFKRINDVLGHEMGDKLLKNIAHNISKTLRPNDTSRKVDANSELASTLARLGGDEFTILLDNVGHQDQIARIAQRLLNSLSEVIVIDNHEFFITASMGIAIYPQDGNNVNTLLKNADMAMYQAKKLGKDGFFFYSEQLDKYITQRFSLESKLRAALENNEFILHYQPQISVQTGHIVGMEALVRWQSPTEGMISPAEFIPIAEETGLILLIGDWVMRTACQQAKDWQLAGLKPIIMSVNVSALQFHQYNLVRSVQNILEDTQLESKFLELEMTEGIIMNNVEKTISDLNELKKLGILLSIDDFGTGYSSMSYLKRFPLNTLKIDKTFIDESTSNPSDAAIVRAIIALAKSLGLQTIAEGVEEEKQFRCLRDLKCDVIQGYYFSKPLPAEEAKEYQLKNNVFP
ncbi:MAG: EAL domain-containing protein [Colwellia sp.]|nr:EAL domain-containing protein [Colwellia sp.]